MQSKSNNQSTAAIQLLLRLFACGAVLAMSTPGQVDPNSPGRISDAITKDNLAGSLSRLKQGNFFLVDVDRIAKAGETQAIPDLKRQFALSSNISKKGKIAIALVKLDDKDGTSWGYLVKEATAAIESGAPSSVSFDSKGRPVPGTSPDFIAWAKARGLSTDAVLLAPIKVWMLGHAGDRRAIPLLRRALSSPDPMIQSQGAEGLADLGDKESIPLIIEACRKAPTEAGFAISEASLLRIDDPDAQSAAKAFAAANAAMNAAK